MLLLLLCFFQGQTESQNEVIIKPMRAQEFAELSSFVVTVPDGLLYVKDENITPMLALTGADYIPNCSGIFFSPKEDWSFCGIIQFFPFQKYDLTPAIEPSVFTDCFSRVHFYYKSPIEEEPEVLYPPLLDEEAQTFTLGYAYKPANDHKSSVCIKKVFRNDQDTILLTIIATNKDSYLRNKAEIDDMLTAIQLSGAPIEPLPMEGTSYMSLLGLGALVSNDQVNSLPMHIIGISVLLGLAGIGLMAFAIRLHKKKNVADGATPEPESPTPSNDVEPKST